MLQLLTKPTFDYDLAMKLLTLSLEAYRDDASFSIAQVGIELSEAIFDEETDTQLYIVVNNKLKKIYVVFRGTSNIHDLLSDVIALKEKYPKEDNKSALFSSRVHKRVLKAYLNIKEKLFIKLDEILNKEEYYEIYSTGHSFGGALATLFAFDCKLKYMDNGVTMYNFGSIRTGNFSFARRYNKLLPNSFRIVNNEDFGARYPKFLYKHIGRLVFISNNKLRVDPSRFFQFLENLDNPIGIATGQAVFDHLAHKYMIVMKNLVVLEEGKLYIKKAQL